MDEDEVLIAAEYIARASAWLSQITQAGVVWLHGVRWVIAAAARMCSGQARLNWRLDSAFQEVQQ